MSDFEWAARPDWMRSWDEAVGLVGTDLRPGCVALAGDEIDRSVIRRFLEPIEFDCPLHYDKATAIRFGYPDIIAPYSGCATWVSPALWQPGETPYYTSDNRDEQPEFRVTPFPKIGPDVNAKVATDLETEFFAPFVLGDRPSKSGCRVLVCSPKETGIGRGAFLTFESDIKSHDGTLIAKIRTSLYYYVTRSTFENSQNRTVRHA